MSLQIVILPYLKSYLCGVNRHILQNIFDIDNSLCDHILINKETTLESTSIIVFDMYMKCFVLSNEL